MSIDQAAVNRMLMSRGLGKLTDPGLIPQIGFLVSRVVTDHDGFRTLIERCEPARRVTMYEQLKPYVRFEPKPLDVYVAEIGMRAEARRLASIDPTTGELRPFRPAEIKTGELAVAQEAVERSLDKFRLTLLCKSCTREQTFGGRYKADALFAARTAGWRFRERELRTELPEAKLEDRDEQLFQAAALVETVSYELCPECLG
jgi:hypothetical protein